jgi:hypothetical protein
MSLMMGLMMLIIESTCMTTLGMMTMMSELSVARSSFQTGNAFSPG